MKLSTFLISSLAAFSGHITTQPTFPEGSLGLRISIRQI